jgi:hypothetical protein
VSIFTIETSPVETLPIVDSFEFQDNSLADQQPQIDVSVGQVVVGQEVATEPLSPPDRLDILAKRAAIERFNSQNARRDTDSAPVNHDANQSFFEGINFTRSSYDFKEEIMFRAAVDFHYNALVNPSV